MSMVGEDPKHEQRYGSQSAFVQRQRARETVKQVATPRTDATIAPHTGWGDTIKESRKLERELAQMKDRAEQAELDRDMWKAEVRRTTDEYVKTTKEALHRAESAERRASELEAKLEDEITRHRQTGNELGAKLAEAERNAERYRWLRGHPAGSLEIYRLYGWKALDGMIDFALFTAERKESGNG